MMEWKITHRARVVAIVQARTPKAAIRKLKRMALEDGELAGELLAIYASGSGMVIESTDTHSNGKERR